MSIAHLLISIYHLGFTLSSIESSMGMAETISMLSGLIQLSLHLVDMVETEVGDVEGGGWGKP